MSQIRYQIFVILVFVFSQLNSQSIAEGDVELLKNNIDVKINNADLDLNRGDYHNGIIHLKSALEIANTIESKSDIGIINTKLANLFLKLKELDSAEVYISRAIVIHSNLDDDINLAVSRYTNGLIYLEKKQYIQAIDLFTNSNIVFEENELNEYISKVALNQGIAHLNIKDFSKASSYLDKAILMSKRFNLPLIESAAHIYNGKVSSELGKTSEAIAQINEGLELNNTTEINNSEIEGYKLLSILYAEKKEYKLAYEKSITYQTLKDSSAIITPYNNELSLIIPEPIKTTNEDNTNVIKEEENDSFGQLTTILSVALITILSLLTLSLYKNNNIRLKTNNMLFKKNTELLTEKEKAEIAAKTKSNFLSTVTHELRTPLYAVTGLTNMLLEENPKPDQIPHLKSLKFSGDYLLPDINRPSYIDDAGERRTEYKMGINVNGKETLIPTVVGGRQLTDDEAKALLKAFSFPFKSK